MRIDRTTHVSVMHKYFVCMNNVTIGRLYNSHFMHTKTFIWGVERFLSFLFHSDSGIHRTRYLIAFDFQVYSKNAYEEVDGYIRAAI